MPVADTGRDADAEFAAFVHARWAAFVRATVFLGCGVHEAQDLTQTALAKCWDKWDRVRAADDPDAYAYRVLLNCLRNSKRRRWWREVPMSSIGTDATPVLQGVPSPGHGEALATTDAVHRALGSLTEDQRQVIVLRYFVNLSEAQTADVVGVPIGTVKSRHARALDRLAASEHLIDLADGSST